MVVLTRTYSSDTSVSSELDDLSLSEKRVQAYAKHMLNGRRFKGTFQEKRYVESLNAYRDVVCLMKDERDLITDISAMKRKLDDFYPNSHWIGITTPDIVGAPAAYSLWVELPENTTFGSYCFKLRRVRFNDKETCLRLKIIYPLDQETHKIIGDNQEQSDNNISPSDIFVNFKQNINDKLLYLLQTITTLSNLKETVKFLFMLLATLVVFLFEFLKYFSEFSLKFMNEFSHFMKSAAPIFQIMADLVDRLFRTMCMFVAFLIKGGNPAPPPIPYVPYQRLKALPPAPQRHSVIIQEIE